MTYLHHLTTLLKSDDDQLPPIISALACLDDDRLVMVDGNNFKVKVMRLSPPHNISSSLHIPETPQRLAVCPDGTLVVTTLGNVIYLLTVTDKVTNSDTQ